MALTGQCAHQEPQSSPPSSGCVVASLTLPDYGRFARHPGRTHEFPFARESLQRKADYAEKWSEPQRRNLNLVLVTSARNGSSSDCRFFATKLTVRIAVSTETELQRQNERLELLLNLTSRITSSLDLREVLRSIAANIREVILADAVVVALPDAASGKFRVFAVDFPHGKDVVKEELLVAPSGAHKRAIDTLKPVVFDTWERDELGPELYDIAAAEGVKTACSIPLVNRGQALGLLSILRKTETPFSPEDVDFLSRASGQIAIAIENALAYRGISELKDKRA